MNHADNNPGFGSGFFMMLSGPPRAVVHKEAKNCTQRSIVITQRTTQLQNVVPSVVSFLILYPLKPVGFSLKIFSYDFFCITFFTIFILLMLEMCRVNTHETQTQDQYNLARVLCETINKNHQKQTR